MISEERFTIMPGTKMKSSSRSMSTRLRRFIRGAASLAILLAATAAARAQQTLPAPTMLPQANLAAAAPLSLEDLEALALTHNPTIPQAVTLVQQSAGDLRQSQLYFNP